MSTTRFARRLSVGTGAAAALALALTGTSAAHAATGGTSSSHPVSTSATTAAQPISGARLMAKLGDRSKIRLVSPGATSGTTTNAQTVSPDIIGGSTTTSAKYPYAVQVLYDLGPANDGTGDDLYQFCGGTLIAPTQVVTAAHCVHGLNYVTNANAFVMGGSTGNWLSSSWTASTTTLASPVIHQWVDPYFAPASSGSSVYKNDVAVLSLAAPVGTSTLPVASAANSSLYTTKTVATVLGWGDTSGSSNTLSPSLKVATLPLAGDTACKNYYQADYVPGDMVCAGSGAGATTTCEGDSGGPLIVGGYLIGVVSYGATTCNTAGSYDVFAKVSTYAGALKDWADSSSPMTAVGTDSNGDQYPINNGLGDLQAHTSAGGLYNYGSTGSVLSKALQTGSDFTGSMLFGQEDLYRSGLTGTLVRYSDGELYYYGWTSKGDNINDGSGELVGSGWNIYNKIVPLGDVAGATAPDLVARDSAGRLWLYLGYGTGKFAPRTEIGTGWGAYNAIVGNGDFNGDGYADLVARDASGNLYYYQGTGNYKAPFKSRVEIGHGFGIYKQMAVANNFTGNGLAALVGVDSSGNLYVYKSTGKAASPLPARVEIGHGFQMYNALF